MKCRVGGKPAESDELRKMLYEATIPKRPLFSDLIFYLVFCRIFCLIFCLIFYLKPLSPKPCLTFCLIFYLTF